MLNLMLSYQSALENKFSEVIENRWFWMIFGLVVLALIGSYAYYCTSRGYAFTGTIKLKWPKVWEMGIGCKPR